ncbi:MAG: ElyC/SanA/YdcF family protein [Desulfobaccales bacterium]
MFLFKKIVASCLLPLPLCLGLLFIGLGLLWFTRRQRSGKILVSAGAGLLLVFSYSAVPDMALRPLELKYPPVADLDAGSGGPQDGRLLGAGSYIVVLGGGINRGEPLPVTSQIGLESLSRLLEGVRLYRAEPGRKLILSGGPVFNPIPESQIMSRVALIMGVNPRDILQESLSRDTEEEARLLKPLVGRERFFLVTSAAHMPRAMALFRRQGLEPVAAPMDLPAQQKGPCYPEDFFPSSHSLQRTEIALHEYLGLAWAWLRGVI